MASKFRKARIIGGLSLAFLAAAATELTGYNMFDREDGGNVLCSLDPACRPLTENETKLAQTVFGDSLNYKNIKVFNRYLFGWKPDGAIARMWNGNIYAIGKDIRSQDYAQEDIPARSLFMHELTHAWGYKNIPAFTLKGIAAIINEDFNYSALYRYDLSDGKKFLDYNLEQQAEIVEDYYRVTEELKNSGISNLKISDDICQSTRLYEERLLPVFPIKPFPGCSPSAGVKPS